MSANQTGSPRGKTDTIEIYETRRSDRTQMVQLYKEAGWWKPENDRQPEFVDKIAEKSYCFVGAFCGQRMIGMGRALSDGVSDAYIQDVTVLREYRGRGIGGKIIIQTSFHKAENMMACIRGHIKPHKSFHYRPTGSAKT